MENKEQIFLRIKNFRSFEDVNIELKPLNLLFGPNGSGKSSLIKAIKFLSHNLFKLDDDGFYMGFKPETYKYFLDKNTDLLSFEEIVRNNDTKNVITFEIKIINTSLYYHLDEFLNIKLLKDSLNDFNVNDTKTLNESEITDIKLIFEIFIDDKFNEKIAITICDLKDNFEYKFYPNSRKFKNGQQLIDCTISINENDPYKEFIESFLEGPDCLPFISSENRINAFNNNAGDFIKLIKNIQNKVPNNEQLNLFKQILRTYSKIFYDIPNKLRDHFFNITHLPPIREIPSPVFLLNNGKFKQEAYYGIPGLFAKDNGVHHVADLDEVSDENNSLVEEDATGKIQIKIDFGRLVSYPELIIKILSKLKLSKGITVSKDKEKIAGWIDYTSFDGKNTNNLAEASSGLLQILPIITTLVQRNDAQGQKIKIIEQPELHLHPKLQAALANFFTSKNVLSDNLIVETHSEHLIRKIQVLVAQANKEKGHENLRKKVGVYYFSKDEKTGITSIKKMEFEDNGFFKEPWPDGFFDDSYNLARELIFARKN